MENLIFRSGNLELAESSDTELKDVKFVIKARTTTPVMYYNIYHDFAGMSAKPRVGIDLEHDPEKMLGFADKYEIKNGETLYLGGFLTPLKEGDDADIVIKKIAKGIPYEASIHSGFDEKDIEWYEFDEDFEVNGKQIKGPAAVIRKWSLRATAVCARGADANTETMLELKMSDEMTAKFDKIKTKEIVMKETKLVEDTEVKETEEVKLTEVVDEKQVEATEKEGIAEVSSENSEQEAVELTETPEVVEAPVVEVAEEVKLTEEVKEDAEKSALIALITELTAKIGTLTETVEDMKKAKVYQGGTPAEFVENDAGKPKKNSPFAIGAYSK